MMDRETRVIVVAAMLAATVVAQAGPVQAQDVAVRYAPYELQSAAGSKVVFTRIQQAVKRACGSGVGSTYLEYKERKLCAAELTAQLVRKVDDRRITALWMGDRGPVQLASRGQ
jgi:UrcA family protein